MKISLVLLLSFPINFLLAQTHILTLPNDVTKEVDIISENDQKIKVKVYPEGKERSIPRSAVVSLVEKMDIPPLNYNDEGRIEFVEVVPVEGMTKDQLFTAAKIWMVNTYVSAEDVIQSEDKEVGLIIGKGVGSISGSKILGTTNVIKIKYTLKIEFKEGKYRASVTNINTHFNVKNANTSIEKIVSDANVNNSKRMVRENCILIRKNLVKHFNDHFDSLKESITKSKSTSDW